MFRFTFIKTHYLLSRSHYLLRYYNFCRLKVCYTFLYILAARFLCLLLCVVFFFAFCAALLIRVLCEKDTKTHTKHTGRDADGGDDEHETSATNDEDKLNYVDVNFSAAGKRLTSLRKRWRQRQRQRQRRRRCRTRTMHKAKDKTLWGATELAAFRAAAAPHKVATWESEQKQQERKHERASSDMCKAAA